MSDTASTLVENLFQGEEPNPQAFDQACYTAVHRYIANCQALRELVDLLASAKRIDDAGPARVFRESTQHLSERQRKTAQKLVLQVIDEMAQPRRGRPSDLESDEATSFREEIQTAPAPTHREAAQPKATDLEVLQAVSDVASELALRAHRTPAREILIRSLITDLVASLEQLLGRLHAAFFSAHPEALGNEKEFSLSDLRSFGSIDEATTASIDARVDAFLRLSFDDWSKWFKDYLGLQIGDFLDGDRIAFEVLQRRNVIVHNDGRVSKQYRHHIGEKAPPLGTVLDLNKAYVYKAIDHVTVFGAVLGAAAWQKIARSEGASHASNSAIHRLNFRLMVLGSWEAVGYLTSAAGTRIARDEQDRIVYKANEWLAEKRLRGVDDVRSDVEAWDISAASLRFRAAKAALLDDQTALLPAIETALLANDITMTDVHQWPLLEEFRATPAYADLVAAHRPKPRARRPASPAVGGEPSGQIH